MLIAGNHYHLFLFFIFFCHSQFGLHCTIARNLHMTMLIKRHVSFTLSSGPLSNATHCTNSSGPRMICLLHPGRIHCSLYLTPSLFKDYAFENLLFKFQNYVLEPLGHRRINLGFFLLQVLVWPFTFSDQGLHPRVCALGLLLVSVLATHLGFHLYPRTQCQDFVLSIYKNPSVYRLKC